MKWINKLFRKFGYRKVSQRSYTAAQVSRLASNWTTQNTSGDYEIKAGLKALRARARELSRNNDYAKKFLNMVMINILGGNGITFQSKIKYKNGEWDSEANDEIETAWADWGKKTNSPEVTNRLSWRDIQRLVMKTIARDGEALIRKVKGFDNKYLLSLQLLEPDCLDVDYNQILSNNGKIKMGVEMDKWNKPVAYHIFVNYPGDYQVSSYQKRVRIPADEIIHLYIPDRFNDSRGIPWMHSAMQRMYMLGGYEEAELTNARVSSSKMGFYTTPQGEFSGDDKDVNENPIQEVEPGIFEKLPPGYDFKSFDPQHPTGSFPVFVKQMLRGIASGLNVAYNSLASDLESVNYSSIRAGTLEERDTWRTLQNWFIENFCQPVFVAWLEMYLAYVSTSFSILDYGRLNQPKWTARTWDWVDPLKDMKANVEGLKAGITSRTEIAAEQGKDFEEQVEILKYEKEKLFEAGLIFELNSPMQELKTIEEELMTIGGDNGKNN